MKVKKRNCEFPNCNKSGRNKGFYKGKTRYDRFCEKHHRLRYGYSNSQMEVLGIGKIDNSKCEVCGWEKSFCDRHRIDPKQGYKKENVKVLCPNCHRLETYGLLSHPN